VVQGKITEADTPTIQMGATPSGPISDPPPTSTPICMPNALPATTLPLYPGLGRAPNMLAFVPSGVVNWITKVVGKNTKAGKQTRQNM